MTDKTAPGGALRRRIAQGKADPISDVERAIVKQMRANYNKKFGGFVTHKKSGASVILKKSSGSRRRPTA